MNQRALLMLLMLLIASPVTQALPPAGKWECHAFDAHKRNYTSIATYLQDAINKAYRSCRNNSQVRSTCRTAQSFCSEGPKKIAHRRCIASDIKGRTWFSNGPNACKSAMAQCNRWQFNHGHPRRGGCMIRHY